MAVEVDESLLVDNLEEDMVPDEISQFFEELGVGKKSFNVMIRKPAGGGGGGWLHVDTLKSQVPSLDLIGEHYGPGDYTLAFSWYQSKSAPGGAKTIIKNMAVSLPSEPWKRRHLRWLAEQDRQAEEEEDRQNSRQIQRATVRSVAKGMTGGASSIEELKVAAQLLRELNPQANRQGINWNEILTGVAAVAGILTPLIAPMLTRKQDFSVKDLLDMNQANSDRMITLLANQNRQSPGEEKVMGLLDTVLKAADRVVSMGAAPEKETIGERIFNMLENIGPQMLLAFANKSQTDREKDPMFKIAAGSEELRLLQTDPQALVEVVNNMDKEWGFDQTNTILEGMKSLGITRPASTLGNRELYATAGES